MSEFRITNEVLDPEYAQKFAAARLGLHKLVVEKDYEIVDVNVSGIYDGTDFKDFKDAEKTYEQLRQELPAELSDSILAQQLTADIILALEAQAKPVPFDEFIKATTGFVPEMIPAETIQALKGRLNLLLSDFGISYDEAGAEDYDKKFVLSEEEDIKRYFDKVGALARAAISQYIALPASLPLPEYFSYEDKYWTAFASTDGKGNPFFHVNTHPSRAYTYGKIFGLSRHETAHLVQMSDWKYQIRRGELSPVLGITSMTSPENTHMEAVAAFAQSDLGSIADVPEQKKVLIQDVYRELNSAVFHNATLRINSGAPEEEVIKEAEEHLPFVDKARIKSLIITSRDNPIARADFIRYAFVEKLMKPLLSAPDSPQKKEAVAVIYKNSLTLDQLRRVIAGATDN
jgi:hypothetical protein